MFPSCLAAKAHFIKTFDEKENDERLAESFKSLHVKYVSSALVGGTASFLRCL